MASFEFRQKDTSDHAKRSRMIKSVARETHSLYICNTEASFTVLYSLHFHIFCFCSEQASLTAVFSHGHVLIIAWNTQPGRSHLLISALNKPPHITSTFNISCAHFLSGTNKGIESGPTAPQTKVGWVLSGTVHRASDSNLKQLNFTNIHAHTINIQSTNDMSKNRALERKLSEFWDSEAIGIQPQTRQMQWEKKRERLEKARQEKNKIQDQ